MKGDMAAETVPSQRELFISHARADRPWVEGYLLPALGLPREGVLTPDRFTPGVPLVAAFEEAVTASRRTLVILTPAYLAEEWAQFGEQLAAFARVRGGPDRLIPLYLQPCELPLHLDLLVRLDFTDEDRWDAEAARLRELLARPAPAAAGPAIPCPYPGMVPFGERDANRFFGREEEVAELRRRLRLRNLVMVIGPSGSGKSSLVLAGLVPELKARQPDQWVICTLRPGGAPVAALNAALAGIVDVPAAPASAALALPADRSLLVVVDQFEEAFLPAGGTGDTGQPPHPVPGRAFIERLKALRGLPRVHLVLTLRSDFYTDLLNSDLWPVEAGERMEIGPLRGDALRRAIERPALNAGVFIEPALVERLLADAADEPGVLPLLQETLVLLWERRAQRYLPLSRYLEMGTDGRSGLAVAVAAKADAALEALPLAQRGLARRVFVRLVHFGEGRPDTRRQQPVEALRSADDAAGALEAVLDHLARNRLLTLTSREAGQADRRVDLSHEALITGWPQLQAWLRERKEAEQARRRLEDKAAEWARLGSGEGGLLDAVELAEADRWLATAAATDTGYNAAVPALVQASRAALDRAAQRAEAARQRELRLERTARQRTQALALFLLALAIIGLYNPVQNAIRRYEARAAVALIEAPGGGVAFEQYEVTNRRYRLCVDAGSCIAPPPQLSTYYRGDSAERPITGVDAQQAADFCAWLGRRLPTLAEWQVAAHQHSRPPWPLSEGERVYEYANLAPEGARNENALPEPVGSRQPTPEKIYDLVGNVEEWTSTSWDPSVGRPGIQSWNRQPAELPDKLTIVGGSYLATLSGLNGLQPYPVDSSYRRQNIGIRCVESR